MSIFEDLQSSASCINMDLQTLLAETDEEKKKVIVERMQQNIDRCMKLSVDVRDNAGAIYNLLNKFYPVALKDVTGALIAGMAQNAPKPWINSGINPRSRRKR